MRIESVHFKNIGVFDDELIEFEPTGNDNQAEIHIITGPNGSGKSTILYGLASVFHKNGHFKNTRNLFHKRFIHFNGQKIIETKSEVKVDADIELSEMFVSFDQKDIVRVYGCTCENIHLETLSETLNEYHKKVNNSGASSATLDFSAFAYSSYRKVGGTGINTLSELKGNPLKNSLSFIKKNDSYSINQWIANNISKRSIAKDKGDKKSHEKYAQTLSVLESILSEILGKQIKFEIGLSPVNLYIKTEGTLLDFDVLPDGMRSLISWIADLTMRLDELKWVDDTPIFERRLFLFLDEIEVHLHPKWQRNILPIVQKLFKNAQIFITTHSPFVVNSVDNAWIHPIRLEGGKATMEKPFKSESGFSYPYILREVFGIGERFGKDAQTKLEDFYEIRDEILRTANPENYISKLKKLQLNTIIENEILNEKVG